MCSGKVPQMAQIIPLTLSTHNLCDICDPYIQMNVNKMVIIMNILLFYYSPEI